MYPGTVHRDGQLNGGSLRAKISDRRINTVYGESEYRRISTAMGWIRLLVMLCVTACLTVAIRADSGGPPARLWPVECVQPKCESELDRTTLWPFEDPNFFLRCTAEGTVQWELERQPCQGRRLFHFTRQTCTLPVDWEATCPDQSGGSSGPLEPCPTVRCATVDDFQRLWPAEDPAQFHQCIPQSTGGIAPVTMVCPPGTLFSVRYQACITSLRWTEECTFDNGELTPDPTGGDTDPTTTITAPPTTTTTESGGWALCDVPVCEAEDPVLYPHTDRTFFWQCVPQPDGFWLPQMRPCGAGTVFHYLLQQCVFPADWVNFCPV